MRVIVNTNQWVKFNHLTCTYDTPDGTCVAAELIESADSASDVWRYASIREKQREEIAKVQGGAV
jgi:hypothetical protein